MLVQCKYLENSFSVSYKIKYRLTILLFSLQVVFHSLQPHGLQRTRFPCPSHARVHLHCMRRRRWHPTPALLPGESHGWRSLVGCSPWGRQELDTTKRLHFDFSVSCIGGRNSNPLQCSCLENPRDGEPGGLPSMGSHRVRHDWSDLAAAAAAAALYECSSSCFVSSPTLGYWHCFFVLFVWYSNGYIVVYFAFSWLMLAVN